MSGAELALTAEELMSFRSTKQAAKIRGQGERTVERKFKGKYVDLGPRRRGLRLHQILELPRPRLPELEPEPEPELETTAPRTRGRPRLPRDASQPKLGRPRKSVAAPAPSRPPRPLA
jgi:hypothetical protein